MTLSRLLPKKLLLPIAFLILTLAGLLAAVLLSRERQELRQKASTGTGTASLSLSPQAGELQPNQANNIAVSVNTAGAQVDGIQLKLSLEGAATATLQDTVVSSLNVLTKTVSGNTITYAAITSNPQQPFSTSTPTQIATITLTPSETVNLVFDKTFSKIVSHGTGEDLLLTPTDGQYTLAQTTSPPPSAAASPSPSPSGSSTPQASPSPSTSSTSPPAIGGNCPRPSTPKNVKARAGDSSGEIIASWQASTGVDHYAISYGTASRDYEYGAADVGNVRSFTIGELQPGKRYYIVVYAVNNCGSSPSSTEVSATATGKTTTASTSTRPRSSPTLVLPSPSLTSSPSATISASPLPRRSPLPFPSPSPLAKPTPPKKGSPLVPILAVLGLAGAGFFAFKYFKGKRQPPPPSSSPNPPTPPPSPPPQPPVPTTTTPPQPTASSSPPAPETKMEASKF